MYCNQCGHKIKDTANFCKKCGAPVDSTEETSERKQRMVRFFYLHKNKILLIFIAALLVCGAATAAAVMLPDFFQKGKENSQPAGAVKAVSNVDLKDSYEIEDNKLSLDPLYVTYEDGTLHELTAYDVYIDTVLYEKQENRIDASSLYDGKHLVRLEWETNGQTYEFEKTIALEHKKDTWEKYVDLVGMTGKEIAEAYGSLGAPVYGDLSQGDWGYAYAEVESLSLQVCFPAGLLDREEDYSNSDSACLEMSGTLNTLFYNMETEMSMEDLETILELSLTPMESGGCSGTLSDGKQIYIGEGAVLDGVYTPDSSVRVTVSEAERESILERIF